MRTQHHPKTDNTAARARVAFAGLALLLAGGCLGTPEQSPPAKPASPPGRTEVMLRNERLERGINMGNALEAPQEGGWGVTIHEDYFDRIREAGFDSVRVPIRWSTHAMTDPPYTIDPKFLARVEEVVNQALERDLSVVINVHHYEEIMKEPDQHLPRLRALWRQIAGHFRDYPNTLYFELLNEPTGRLSPELWNDCAAQLVAIVRESNPDRTIIIGTAEWGGLKGLDKLKIPEADANLIVTFHYYEPFHFTHQGASWVGGSEPWLGTRWTGSDSERLAVREDMDRAAIWAEENKRPLYMGEFGAYRKADMGSRARWTAFVAREAEKRGIPWSYWEFCSGFGAYDPEKEVWKAPLLKALLPDEENAGKAGGP